MDWSVYLDNYCERLAPGLWGEPLNTISNLAFLIAAAIMLRRARGHGLIKADILIGLLAFVGVGSLLFHTYATRWSAMADALPIFLFILVYLYAASRDFIGMKPGWAFAVVLAFPVYAGYTGNLLEAIPGIGGSAGYATIPPIILGYAALMVSRAPETARFLALGAMLLIISIFFRSIDLPVCASFPPGTHFVWHLLNAVMLAWMIELYIRHMVASPADEG